MISLSKVSKSFDEAPALKDINLEIAKSEVIAVLGQSGSGKSTLLRLINLLEVSDKGKFELAGDDTGLLSPAAIKSLQSRIAYIPQGLGLVQRLSALENVLQGASSRLFFPRLGIASYPSKMREEAMEALGQLGLKDLALRRVDTLSGGEKQRVAIARCLMQKLILLLADEPISSVDPVTAKRILTILRSVSRNLGIPVVIALHQPEAAKEFADRIVGLRKGRLLFDLDSKKVNSKHIEKLYSKSRTSR